MPSLSLSRTTSLESATSLSKSVIGSVDGDPAEMSGPPSPRPDASISERHLGVLGRTPSHSLLSSSPHTSAANRKSRFADAGTVGASVGRASISMPPPPTKPSSIYRPAASRHPSAALSAMDAKPAGLGMDYPREDQTAGGDSAAFDGLQKTPSQNSLQAHGAEPQSPSALPESNLRLPPPNLNRPGERLSLSSVYSLGSAIYNQATGMGSAPQSAASSNAGSIKSGASEQPTSAPTPLSPPLGAGRGEAVASATTATDPVLVSANSQQSHLVSLNTPRDAPGNNFNAASRHLESWNTGALPRTTAPVRQPRSKSQRHPSGSTAASSAGSPQSSDRAKITAIGIVGVCALDVKARSKACRNILTRLQSNGEFDVIIFGDKVILDEDVENWPVCDFLISFFSDGFPLDKAIAYSSLRRPFSINDLPMQKILWDRRLCLRILDSMGVPTPRRVEVNRDGGPRVESAKLAEHLYKFSGVKLEGAANGTGGGLPLTENVSLCEDGDSIFVDGVVLKKPFVEKPTSGEDHNIHIYFPKSHPGGGGGRRLFRKIGNKSSEWDENMVVPRSVTEEGSSYIYEQFLHVDNAEDIKAYTVGPDFCHAETRTSPVVDGLVRRNTHGKEIRYICNLNPEEQMMARKIATGFGQRICGFDMLRVQNQSFVIDVNGWSFVKDNNAYYDKCASIMKQLFLAEKQKREGAAPTAEVAGGDPVERAQAEKAQSEKSVNHRKNATGHRSAFRNMIKSPSMSKLRGHNLSQQSTTSPNISPATAPISSPPTFQNETRDGANAFDASTADQLPPPAFSPDQSYPGTGHVSPSIEASTAIPVPQPASKHSWKLKGMVSVIRHADRTPKQKFKFTFHTQPFVELLKGHREEVLLKGEAALNSVLNAVKVAMKEGIEDQEKLQVLRTSLVRKGAWTGTKVQIKPMFRKRKPQLSAESQREKDNEPGKLVAARTLSKDGKDSLEPLEKVASRSDSLSGTTFSRFSAAENDLIIDKLQLIVKWGGEPTHSARYQAQDLGENMRNDFMLMNKQVLEDVHIFTSSERRVSTSAQIWAASFLNEKEFPESSITVRKDLLDDSNAAKDEMDKVKKKLKLLLREGQKAPPQFAWPSDTPEPSVVVRKVAELMVFHRKVMRDKFKRINSGAAASLSALGKPGEGGGGSLAGHIGSLAQAKTVSSIQARWCTGEDPELFKERWEKLFSEFCDSEKTDPSKISELYDTMKFDALHNRQFLEWVFTPGPGMLEDDKVEDANDIADSPSELRSSHSSHSLLKHEPKNGGEKVLEKTTEKPSNGNLAHRIGLRRRSMMLPLSPPSLESQESYFKLYAGTGQTKAKQDVRLEKLRELYKLTKVLFDFVCPQEYGISNEEKLEIGLLTSLPLLKEIVIDLEEVQASEGAKSFVYFTKESHIYTLLNCILEGGIKTKIERNAIPELDYLSNITFELYESEDKDAATFTYSIRISITPGCHTFDPLDVQLDSKHSIGCAPRRSLTAHQDWKEVLTTLRAKFDTVKLPKSFLAINISNSHTSDEVAQAAAEE